VDKPVGWTSFDVVKRLRSSLLRRLRRKKFKVGHAGTLDPLASGLMIITTGRATKLIETLQAGVKEYVATLALGSTTPSFDLETEIDATYPTGHITRELIDSVLPDFHGTIEQVPPAFSACKIDGQRAYEMARRGETVELKAKILVIDEIEVIEFDPAAMTLTLRIVCSKGTYIRALARDIGAALGSGAHLTALRRTRVGDLTVDHAMDVATAADLIRDCRLAPEEDAGAAS
ncbi:MAG: tRNA pseudouridine(55) synthase TruB, partial [Candidatus Amulumruptor sp.]|nr:tRNA pseudouridine(55) synthase TruB [Candidatus Amulumruptor sp.]